MQKELSIAPERNALLIRPAKTLWGMIYQNFHSVTLVLALSVLIMTGQTAYAEDATVIDAAPLADMQFILNSLLFLIGGFLVMFMAAGFAMLEVGMVRAKNASMQCAKNLALYSLTGITFWVIGYNLMYSGVGDGGFIGSPTPFDIPDPSNDSGDYTAASDWFFQMVFCAATASIVSGTLAERIKLWPFLIFVIILTGIIYPIQGSWKWGGGWLDDVGFNDFAGSTIVHSVGGWAAFAGALILGPRFGKFSADGRVLPMTASNIPLATLGTFILWLGWFGFNGGSQLAMGTISDISSISRIFANTNFAAAAGCISAMMLTHLLYKKVDVTMVLNGALAGLVSITAEPLTPSPMMAIVIGGIGGVLVVLTVPLLDRFRIDDVVGAIPVHLVCGIWGTLVVPLTNSEASFSSQIIGIVAIAAFVLVTSTIVWLALKYTMGIRVDDEDQVKGLDLAEIGIEAYPEFSAGKAGY